MGDMEGNFSDDVFRVQSQQKPLHDRIPKAAFFSTYRHLRRLVYDQAVLRPDLIDAPVYLTASHRDDLSPWNKNSVEPSSLSGEQYKEWLKMNNSTVNKTQPGFISYLANVSRDENQRYIPGHYKYIVVIGYEGSTTGRMAQLLAHSGAHHCPVHTVVAAHTSHTYIPS